MTGTVLFFLIAGVIVASSVAMLVSRDFVRSVLFLLLALCSFAGLYALLDATFLALLQLFLFAGAVTVVLVFVVMLTRPQIADFRTLLQRQTAFAAVAVVAISVPMLDALVRLASSLPAAGTSAASTSDLARALMGDYGAPFELASVVLLAALVGAIYLAREAE
ncbi:MAG TPA: NADH-quinone oxidoreductase subunit J [Coriobacteriia bacterium]